MVKIARLPRGEDQEIGFIRRIPAGTSCSTGVVLEKSGFEMWIFENRKVFVFCRDRMSRRCLGDEAR
jgi:hypothetical protein